jgi:hypothetical protein
MTQKFIKALSRILWDSDLIASRFTLALGEFFWAVMLLWPGDTFGRPTYTHMATVMNEELWGILFLVSSIIQLSIILRNVLHSHFARCFAFWNAILWGYTVLSMMISVYPPPAAIGGELSMALMAVWIWCRPYILAEGLKRARQQ